MRRHLGANTLGCEYVGYFGALKTHGKSTEHTYVLYPGEVWKCSRHRRRANKCRLCYSPNGSFGCQHRLQSNFSLYHCSHTARRNGGDQSRRVQAMGNTRISLDP